MADWLGIHFTTAEEVADKVLSDLLHGVNPVDYGSEPLEVVNRRFNQDIDRYTNGELPSGFRFKLGYPSPYLLSAGFADLPISMRASLLSRKAGDERHPFVASALKDLVKKLQKPISIFTYSKDNMRNLIVDIQSKGKHFLVGVTLNYNEINSVSGLFPKESHEWIKWIQDGKAIRIDEKEKVLSIIDSLRTNPAESERIGLNLELAAKIVESFENPKISEEKISDDEGYDVTKIEALDDTTTSTSDGLVGATMGLKPLANLLKDVEKSYDKGKKSGRRMCRQLPLTSFSQCFLTKGKRLTGGSDFHPRQTTDGAPAERKPALQAP